MIDHWLSVNANHVLTDLRRRFDEILAQLESVAGWKTARIRRPVLVLGSLDGIETGIRQLIRAAPPEMETIALPDGGTVTLPTRAEMLRIKAILILILKRNATHDYLDFAALARSLGERGHPSRWSRWMRSIPRKTVRRLSSSCSSSWPNPFRSIWRGRT